MHLIWILLFTTNFLTVIFILKETKCQICIGRHHKSTAEQSEQDLVPFGQQ
jgi:hypothetical protein